MNAASDPAPTYADRLALLALGTLQALALVLLWRADGAGVWPASDPRWFDALRAVAIGTPFFLLLTAMHWRERANAYAALGAAVVLFALGWHLGWLRGDDDPHHHQWELTWAGIIVTFIAAFLVRGYRLHGGFAYRGLLDASWRNALVAGFLALFLLVFWLLLVLWGQLFVLVGIRFFRELFEIDDVRRILYGIAGGWGAGLILSRVGLVISVRHLCELLTRTLLPLVALILLAFVGTLAFTGVDQLFETGHAASLLLALAAVLLFFFNAVLADEADAFLRSRWLARFVLVAVVVSPAVVAVAAWALGLRIGEYGLTVARLWGVFVAAFLGAFSVGYAAILLRHRGRLQLPALHRWNTVLAFALAAALCVVNLPPFDFHRVAADAQVGRLESGAVSGADFDAFHLRWDLGRYGRERLAALRDSELAARDDALRARIDDALASENRWERHATRHPDFQEVIVAAPGVTIDDAFVDAVRRADACRPGAHVECRVIDVTLRDGEPVRVLAGVGEFQGFVHLQAFWNRDGAWAAAGSFSQVECGSGDWGAWPVPAHPRFDVYGVGSCRYQFMPNAEYLDRAR